MMEGPDDLNKPTPHVGGRRSLVWRLASGLAFAASALLWLGWQFWALNVETERIALTIFV